MLLVIPVLPGCVSSHDLEPPNLPFHTISSRQGKGIYHKVKTGETLWRIAKTYDIAMEELLKSNNIPDIAQIEKNQLIFIPGANQQQSVAHDKVLKDSGEFLWPVKGKVVSYFGQYRGGGKNKGVDIQANQGDTVVASRSGKVVFADYLNGYAHTVILDHADDFYSVYAQNGKLIVSLDQDVEQGTPIAEVGKSYSGLHFEIRKKAKANNPLFYLH